MSPPDSIQVTKMSGAGNDFVVVEAEQVAALEQLSPRWVELLCRRGLSLGADGVLIVEPVSDNRVRLRFFNPDGSTAFCGNGTRCAARFANLRGMTGETLVVETAAGDVGAEILGDVVRIRMRAPRERGVHRLAVGDRELHGRWIDAGCPHFVVAVDDLDRAPLAEWGAAVHRAELFAPHGTNLDLCLRRSDDEDGSMRIRTWERGVDAETLACGSGAIAAAYAAMLEGAPPTVQVVPASGCRLEITLIGELAEPSAVELSGDARVVLRGEIDAEALGC